MKEMFSIDSVVRNDGESKTTGIWQSTPIRYSEYINDDSTRQWINSQLRSETFRRMCSGAYILNSIEEASKLCH